MIIILKNLFQNKVWEKKKQKFFLILSKERIRKKLKFIQNSWTHKIAKNSIFYKNRGRFLFHIAHLI